MYVSLIKHYALNFSLQQQTVNADVGVSHNVERFKVIIYVIIIIKC